jgi:hypothetical protein
MAALSTVVDTFRTLDPARWSYTAASASIVTGRLQLVPSFAGPPGASRLSGEAWSITPGDLRGDRLTMELPAPGEGVSQVTELAVFTDQPRANALLWLIAYDPTSVWGFQLQAVRRIAGVSTVVATLYPDSQQQRWLGFEEDAGTVTWLTSPDGVVWDAAGSATVSLDLSAVRIAVGSWYQSPGDLGPTPVQFDNLNVDQTAGDVATVTGGEGDPYLAVDVQPDVSTGTFVVGVSALGGPGVLAWSADDVGTWVNIVCDVRRDRKSVV